MNLPSDDAVRVAKVADLPFADALNVFRLLTEIFKLAVVVFKLLTDVFTLAEVVSKLFNLLLADDVNEFNWVNCIDDVITLSPPAKRSLLSFPAAPPFQ